MTSQHDVQSSSSVTTTVHLEYTLLIFSTNLYDPLDVHCSIRNHSFETEMMRFIEQANKHNYFAAEISDIYRNDISGNKHLQRFKSNPVLAVRTHFKPTQTLQNTHFSSCHSPGVKKDFIKGAAQRLVMMVY